MGMDHFIVLLFFFILLPVNTAWHFSSGANIKWVKLVAGLNIASLSYFSPTIFPVRAELAPAPWSEKIQYEVLKEAPTSASLPKIGDLVAIRFRASFGSTVIDDVFKTADPYYYRCGVGSVIQGLDETVLHMKEGERVHVQFGGDLGFGNRGLPSAPGRPRIPPNAVLDYEVELTQIPGSKEEGIEE